MWMRDPRCSNAANFQDKGSGLIETTSLNYCNQAIALKTPSKQVNVAINEMVRRRVR
jgi:hypothetical protein